MTKQRNKAIIRLLSILFALVLVIPQTAFAATPDSSQPYASRYLTSYSAYVYVTSSGTVQVWFDVMGTGDMDEIGALSIILYESSDGTNWTRVKSFLHESTEDMLFEDDYYVSSHVSWANGSTSKQYKAYVCVWAGKNGTGDTRYFWAYEP